MGKDYLLDLMRSKSTIFTTKDVSLLWGEPNVTFVTKKLYRYIKAGKLYSVRKGIYAKDKTYEKYELATKICTPSYISFETVLTRAGVNFQYYGNTFVATYVTREIEAGDQKMSFIRMKDYVLSNTAGIEHPDGIATATKERAFLDRIYVSKDYHFDNLDALDWNKVFEFLPIYHNKRMEKKVKTYFEHYKNNQSDKKENV